MNIIHDCQDRVFSRYRAAATPAVQTPPVNALRSPSLNVSFPNSHMMGCDSFISSMTTGNSPDGLLPAFFEPPEPQSHLSSRLEISTLEAVSPRSAEHNLSDSGYLTLMAPPLTPPLQSPYLRSSMVVSNSQLSDSSLVPEQRLTQQDSRRDVSDFDGTSSIEQESQRQLESNSEMRNTAYSPWMNESYTSDGVDWSQFFGMDTSMPP